jgi:hypothetical protein
MKLNEWMKRGGGRYAEEIDGILAGLGYASPDRFPPFQVIDNDRDELIAVARTIGKFIIIPPDYSASTLLPIVPTDLARAPVLFIGPSLREFPLAVASESLAFCLAFIEGCLRYASRLPYEARRLEDMANDEQSFSLALQYLAARFAFERFLRALAGEQRRFNVENFMEGFYAAWDAALGLTHKDRDLSRTSCLCLLAELSGRAVALKGIGLDIWDQRVADHPSPADILRSSFGPTWRGLPDLLAEIDTFDTAMSRLADLAERLKALAEPNDPLSIAVLHVNRASNAFWDESRPAAERGRAIGDDLNRALDAIEEAMGSNMSGAKQQLATFIPVFGQCVPMYSNQPEVVGAFRRFSKLMAGTKGGE